MATEDAGFTHTDEILANTAASYELPKWLHICVSTPSPPPPKSTQNHGNTGLQGAQLPPVITRRKATTGQDSSALRGFGDAREVNIATLPSTNGELARIRDLELDGDPGTAAWGNKGSGDMGPRVWEGTLGTGGLL